jgi:hypothetical protein
MAQDRQAIFRDAALARLASPERLETRLALPRYPRWLMGLAGVLAALAVAFAVWLIR